MPPNPLNPPSKHPTLDRFKAQLAAMSPDERKKTFLLLAQIVKQRVRDAEGGK